MQKDKEREEFLKTKAGRQGYIRLVSCILFSFKEEDGERIIRFAKSKWAKNLCESIDVDYKSYRKWAEEKGRQMLSPHKIKNES